MWFCLKSQLAPGLIPASVQLLLFALLLFCLLSNVWATQYIQCWHLRSSAWKRANIWVWNQPLVHHKYKKTQFKSTRIHTVHRFLLILSDKGKHININIAQNYDNCQLPCLEKKIMALKGDKITFLILHSNKICTLRSLYSLQNHATHSFCNIFIHIVRILSVAQVLHAIICYLILGFWHSLSWEVI